MTEDYEGPFHEAGRLQIRRFFLLYHNQQSHVDGPTAEDGT